MAKLENYFIDGRHPVTVPAVAFRVLSLCDRLGIEAVVAEVERFRVLTESVPNAWRHLPPDMRLLKRVKAAGYTERDLTATLACLAVWRERLAAGLPAEDDSKAASQTARAPAAPRIGPPAHVDPSKLAQFVLLERDHDALRRELAFYHQEGVVGRRLGRLMRECRGATPDLISTVLADLQAHADTMYARLRE